MQGGGVWVLSPLYIQVFTSTDLGICEGVLESITCG
jgi:hypothetical protein